MNPEERTAFDRWRLACRLAGPRLLGVQELTGAKDVPARAVDQALRQQIGLTWRQLHQARRQRNQEYSVSPAYQRYADHAGHLQMMLLALVDVWADARRAVRR